MIGENIKILREKNKISQETLARKAHLTLSTVQRMEKNKGCTFTSLQKIANALEIEVSELLKK